MKRGNLNPVVSIVIPCYNVGQTLKKCLDSVRNQTFETYEVFLIDDGSEDDTGDIAGRYCEKDSRFFLIPCKHAGVSAARNAGINRATAPYICFVDADDLLPADSLELRIKSMEADPGADLLIGNYETNDSRLYHCTGMSGSYSMEKVKEHFSCHMISLYYGVLWNKLYRTRLVREHMLKFQEGIFWSEDFLFNLEYMKLCRSICYLDENIYYYNRFAKSIRDDYSAYWQIQVMRMIKMQEFLNTDEDSKFRTEFCKHFYQTMNAELSTVICSSESLKKKHRRFSDILVTSRPVWERTGRYAFLCDDKILNRLHQFLRQRDENYLFVFYLIKGFCRRLPLIRTVLDKKKKAASFE